MEVPVPDVDVSGYVFEVESELESVSSFPSSVAPDDSVPSAG